MVLRVVVFCVCCAVEDRKDWLRGFKAGTHADYNVESVTYESFINKELILFSVGVRCATAVFKVASRLCRYEEDRHDRYYDGVAPAATNGLPGLTYGNDTDHGDEASFIFVSKMRLAVSQPHCT